MARKSGPGKRYSTAEKKRILDVARSEGLTGAQVRERFGVSTLSFYRWRGPVRPRRSVLRALAPATSPELSEQVRAHVRAGVQRVLPQIVREEVAAYLAATLSAPRGRRGR
jgi:transposase-like protein